jgi:hypothetical protein
VRILDVSVSGGKPLFSIVLILIASFFSIVFLFNSLTFIPLEPYEKKLLRIVTDEPYVIVKTGFSYSIFNPLSQVVKINIVIDGTKMEFRDVPSLGYRCFFNSCYFPSNFKCTSKEILSGTVRPWEILNLSTSSSAKLLIFKDGFISSGETVPLKSIYVSCEFNDGEKILRTVVKGLTWVRNPISSLWTFFYVFLKTFHSIKFYFIALIFSIFLMIFKLRINGFRSLFFIAFLLLFSLLSRYVILENFTTGRFSPDSLFHQVKIEKILNSDPSLIERKERVLLKHWERIYGNRTYLDSHLHSTMDAYPPLTHYVVATIMQLFHLDMKLTLSILVPLILFIFIPLSLVLLSLELIKNWEASLLAFPLLLINTTMFTYVIGSAVWPQTLGIFFLNLAMFSFMKAFNGYNEYWFLFGIILVIIAFTHRASFLFLFFISTLFLLILLCQKNFSAAKFLFFSTLPVLLLSFFFLRYLSGPMPFLASILAKYTVYFNLLEALRIRPANFLFFLFGVLGFLFILKNKEKFHGWEFFFTYLLVPLAFFFVDGNYRTLFNFYQALSILSALGVSISAKLKSIKHFIIIPWFLCMSFKSTIALLAIGTS